MSHNHSHSQGYYSSSTPHHQYGAYQGGEAYQQSASQHAAVQPHLDGNYSSSSFPAASSAYNVANAYQGSSATPVTSQQQETLGSALQAGTAAASFAPMTTGEDINGQDDAAAKKRHRVSRACDECRRKKIRCDAQSETNGPPVQACTSCKRSNINCSFSRVPMKRGPSKGYIKELEERLNSLESALGREATLATTLGKATSGPPPIESPIEKKRGKNAKAGSQDPAYSQNYDHLQQGYQQQTYSPAGYEDYRNQYYQQQQQPQGYGNSQQSYWNQETGQWTYPSYGFDQAQSAATRPLDQGVVAQLLTLYKKHVHANVPLLADLDADSINAPLQNVLRVYFDPASSEQDILAIAGQVVGSTILTLSSSRSVATALRELLLLTLAADRAMPTQAGNSISLYLLGAANNLTKISPAEGLADVNTLLQTQNAICHVSSRVKLGEEKLTLASTLLQKTIGDLYDGSGHLKEVNDKAFKQLKAHTTAWLAQSKQAGKDAASEWIKFSPDAHQILAALTVVMVYSIARETERKKGASKLEEYKALGKEVYDRLVVLLRTTVASETVDNGTASTTKDKAGQSMTTLTWPKAWYVGLRRVIALSLGITEEASGKRNGRAGGLSQLETLASLACADTTGSKRKRGANDDGSTKKREPSIAVGVNESAGFCSDDIADWVKMAGIKGAVFGMLAA